MLLFGGLLLAGCAVPASVALPAGVTVDVAQSRSDIDTGTFAIRVRNNSTETVTITRAEYDSHAYLTPMVFDSHEAELKAGAGVDLRITPAAPNCTRADADATVVLQFRLSDGRTGSATLVPADPFSQFPRIPDQACLVQHLAEIATVTPTAVESSGSLGARGSLVLEVTPSGASGTAQVTGTGATVLLGPLDASGAPTQELALDLTITGTDPPSELRIPVFAARCDPHAIAEDKVGTLIPLTLTINGVTGTLTLPSSAAFKASVYAYVQSSCGFTSGG